METLLFAMAGPCVAALGKWHRPPTYPTDMFSEACFPESAFFFVEILTNLGPLGRFGHLLTLGTNLGKGTSADQMVISLAT